MTHVTHNNGWVIVVVFIVAFMLSLMPIPVWARYFRPQWVTLALIYWNMALPKRVNIGTAWIIGIIEDILTGSLLGQHSLALSVTAFITIKLHLRIRIFPLWQQSCTIMLLLLLERLIQLWIMGATEQPTPSVWYWLPVFTSALLWSWVYIILRDIRRRFNVS